MPAVTATLTNVTITNSNAKKTDRAKRPTPNQKQIWTANFAPNPNLPIDLEIATPTVIAQLLQPPLPQLSQRSKPRGNLETATTLTRQPCLPRFDFQSSLHNCILS